MAKKDIVIFGTGEIAELAHYYMVNDSDFNIVAFTADREYIESTTFLDKPLIPFENIEKHFSPDKFGMHVALSYSKLNLTSPGEIRSC